MYNKREPVYGSLVTEDRIDKNLKLANTLKTRNRRLEFSLKKRAIKVPRDSGGIRNCLRYSAKVRCEPESLTGEDVTVRNLSSQKSSFMSKSPLIKPLGTVLQQADLVSEAQVEVALQDKAYYPELCFGEILASRGWLKQQTADFFVEQWPNLVNQKQKPLQPLGQYLKVAALLDESQIQAILSEQRQGQTWSRFGALAVFRGYLKQTTLDFFLESLFSSSSFSSSSIVGHSDSLIPPNQKTEVEATQGTSSSERDEEPSSEGLDDDEIKWID